MSQKNKKKNQTAGYDPGHQDPNIVDTQAGEKFDEGQADADPTPPTTTPDPVTETAIDNRLERAALLLKEARSGFLSVIGGSGPYEDKISGIFFQRIEGKESKIFLLSQWETLVDTLLKEIDHGA